MAPGTSTLANRKVQVFTFLIVVAVAKRAFLRKSIRRLLKTFFGAPRNDEPIVGHASVLRKVQTPPGYVVLSVKYDLRSLDGLYSESRYSEYCQKLLGVDKCYSPNRYSKGDCGRDCLGRCVECLLPVEKSKKPRNEDCWKSSYRWHLDGSNGQTATMLRIRDGQCGIGQRIEARMAVDLGIDVVEVEAPRSTIGFEKIGKIRLLNVVLVTLLCIQTCRSVLATSQANRHTGIMKNLVRWALCAFCRIAFRRDPGIGNLAMLYAGHAGQLICMDCLPRSVGAAVFVWYVNGARRASQDNTRRIMLDCKRMLETAGFEIGPEFSCLEEVDLKGADLLVQALVVLPVLICLAEMEAVEAASFAFRYWLNKDGTSTTRCWNHVIHSQMERCNPRPWLPTHSSVQRDKVNEW